MGCLGGPRKSIPTDLSDGKWASGPGRLEWLNLPDTEFLQPTSAVAMAAPCENRMVRGIAQWGPSPLEAKSCPPPKAHQIGVGYRIGIGVNE